MAQTQSPPVSSEATPKKPRRRRHPIIAALIITPLLVVVGFALGAGVFEATKKCVDKTELARLVHIDNQMRRDYLKDLGRTPIGSVRAYEQQVLAPDLVNRAANAHAIAELFSDYPEIADQFFSGEKRLDHAANLILHPTGDYMKKANDEVLAAFADMDLGMIKANDEARAC